MNFLLDLSDFHGLGLVPLPRQARPLGALSAGPAVCVGLFGCRGRRWDVRAGGRAKQRETGRRVGCGCFWMVHDVGGFGSKGIPKGKTRCFLAVSDLLRHTRMASFRKWLGEFKRKPQRNHKPFCGVRVPIFRQTCPQKERKRTSRGR